MDPPRPGPSGDVFQKASELIHVCVCFQTQKWLHFDIYTIPDAEIFGICTLFRDLSFEQYLRPWKGAREPKIDVSGTQN